MNEIPWTRIWAPMLAGACLMWAWEIWNAPIPGKVGGVK